MTHRKGVFNHFKNARLRIGSKRLAFLGMLLLSTLAFSKPVEVDVAYPLKKKIIEWDEYTGRFRAIDEVDIRARVTGYLEAIKFKDGQMVKKGDVLFIIDPRPFQFALDKNNAQFNLAKKQYDRAVKLQKSKYVSEDTIDQRYQQMQVTRSQVNDAKLNLEYTQVKSPINGQISRHNISVGNLITKNDTVLTRVVSQNPIYFYFEINQNDLLKYIRLDQSGKRKRSNESPTPIKIKLQDEKTFLHQGKVSFIDNIIDMGTGTIVARAQVPNPGNIIYPGLFGRAQMAGSDEYEAILLPDVAINSDQSKKFVYVLTKDNKIKRRYIELGPIRPSGYYIIKKGLSTKARVVVKGIQRIQNSGQAVAPNLVSLKESAS